VTSLGIHPCPSKRPYADQRGFVGLFGCVLVSGLPVSRSSGESAVCASAESHTPLIQETSKEAPRDQYELHRFGQPQEDDQLLREGRCR
jgi:hypothetical protein